jgi:hypothetical protein
MASLPLHEQPDDEPDADPDQRQVGGIGQQVPQVVIGAIGAGPIEERLIERDHAVRGDEHRQADEPDQADERDQIPRDDRPDVVVMDLVLRRRRAVLPGGADRSRPLCEPPRLGRHRHPPVCPTDDPGCVRGVRMVILRVMRRHTRNRLPRIARITGGCGATVPPNGTGSRPDCKSVATGRNPFSTVDGGSILRRI